jgi:hypothetical protein
MHVLWFFASCPRRSQEVKFMQTSARFYRELGSARRASAMGTRMKFPDYPSNRETDERAKQPLSQDGKAPQ